MKTIRFSSQGPSLVFFFSVSAPATISSSRGVVQDEQTLSLLEREERGERRNAIVLPPSRVPKRERTVVSPIFLFFVCLPARKPYTAIKHTTTDICNNSTTNTTPAPSTQTHNKSPASPSLRGLSGLLGGLAAELGLVVSLDGELRAADGRGTGNGSGAQVSTVAGLGDHGGDGAVGPAHVAVSTFMRTNNTSNPRGSRSLQLTFLRTCWRPGWRW